MGVSGCGKSSVGALLAERLGVDFLEGDDLHSPASITKMAAGEHLADDDRGPWLCAVADWLGRRSSEGGGVVSCSALKRSYRDLLVNAAPTAVFLHLHGQPDVLRERMRGREHFMPASLLDSQLSVLEPLKADENGVTLDIGPSAEQIVTNFLVACGGP